MNQSSRKIVIAIDGFSSCGKSTFAKAIAARLGYIFIDTGAMYRAVTLYSLEHGAVVDGEVQQDKVVELLPQIEISFRFNAERGASDIYVNGVEVEQKIRSIEVSNLVSKISSIAQVREKLVAMQQRMGQERGVVMDGRDIGTVILPNAQVKVYLTASVEVRAERRYKELVEKGLEADLEKIKKDIEERDYRDMNRDIAPLRQAEDATLVDSSYLTIEESAAVIMNLIDKKMA